MNTIFIYNDRHCCPREGFCQTLTEYTPYLQIYTRWGYISRETCFFMLLSRDIDTRATYCPGQLHPGIDPQWHATAQLSDWSLC